MIYLVLFCYCFRVIPILIMKNSFKVNTIIYVYWYIYIHRKDKLFTSICPYTLNFPLDSIFCKILHLISNTKKKIIANNYIELKPNEFFCVHKLHKLISPKKKTFLEPKCKYLQVAACKSNINGNVFLFLSLNIFTKHFWLNVIIKDVS